MVRRDHDQEGPMTELVQKMDQGMDELPGALGAKLGGLA
jgi:hypothetical protein